LGIETLSIALYILAGFARRRLMSNEAALKYFLLGAFATGFLLYGIALTYFAVGSTHMATIANSLTGGAARSVPLLYIGIALILIGLAFKAALVPFHQWTPDVYEGSPTPITAFMAVGAKAAAFAALIRILPGAFGPLSQQWHGLVLVLAVLTMSVGNIVAISQTSLKRMLAYSSIAHAGYVLIGVLAAASGIRGNDEGASQLAIASVLYYLLAYALMNLGAFAVLVSLENARAQQAGGEGLDETTPLPISDLSGLAMRQPFSAAAMTIFLVSLAGIPPTVGFFGKLFIFREAIGQGLIGLVLVGVINSVISVYYYLRPVVAMYAGSGSTAEFGSTDVAVSSDGSAVVAPRSAALSLPVMLAIAACAILVLAMIVLQQTAMPWAIDAARSVLGNSGSTTMAR
ncbi:MAG TPA: NADH-quinone oxidoreductase subunit N, partial [Abditibacteriaceae bacterium]